MISAAALWSRARQASVVWLREHAVDLAWGVLVIALTLFVRWASLDPIESGGDPLDNWFFVKQWAHNTGLFSGYLNHHNTRFGIHGLTWVVQRVFGTEPVYYFIAPVFASTVCSLLLFVLGCQVASRGVGVIAVLMLLEFDGFIPASSQLRPGVFEAMYVLAAMCCLVLALGNAGRRRDWALASAGVCSFMAWLAKEPTAFFLPGMFLVVVLSRKGWRDVLIFCGSFAILLGLETLAYNVFTNYPHRAAVIIGAHGRTTSPATDFWYLFTRFTKAADAWRLVYYFFSAAALALLATSRSLAQKAVVLVAASFLFLATFAIRRINPLGLWMPMNDRYLTAAVPLALCANAIIVVEAAAAARGGLERRLPAWSRGRLSLSSDRSCALLGALVLGLCMAAMAWKTWALSAENRASHPLTDTRRAYSLISDAYARGLPIVGAVSGKPKRPGAAAQVRSLHWAVKGFVDERLLLDENGSLPHFSYSSLLVLGKKQRYLPVKPPLAETDVQKLLAQDADCVLVLKDVKSGPTVLTSNSGWKMPEHCRAPAPAH